MVTRFIKVKVHKRSIGKWCQHCHTSATVTALRRQDRFKMPVWYCLDHAKQRGAVQ